MQLPKFLYYLVTFITYGCSIKKLVGRVSALLTHFLGEDGLENFAILQGYGPENFVILWVGGIVRPPHMMVYGRNSGGGRSKKPSADTLPTNFSNGIALSDKEDFCVHHQNTQGHSLLF